MTIGHWLTESSNEGKSGGGLSFLRGNFQLRESESLPTFPPLENLKHKVMSQHRSLKGASKIAAKRNVLKRFERVDLLKKRGQFKDGDKVLGLVKTTPEA